MGVGRKKVAMLLSGGVDSSVALSLLHDSGSYQIDAYYLKIWLEDDLAHLGDCPWEEDVAYGRQICEQLGISLRIVPLQREYWDRVVRYTIAELKMGRTPSPDIFCNQRIKFGAFVDKLIQDYDFIASGHYASIDSPGAEEANLLRGVDPIKDQSYFLSHLSADQTRHCLFPLGDLPKSQVRKMAERMDLPNHARPDSQGICFLGKIKYNEFVKFHLGEQPGEIREQGSEKILGEHQGIWFHTIGQRKGLGLTGGPWFVVGKDVEQNRIYVSHQRAHMQQATNQFEIANPNWIHAPPQSGQIYSCKVRHGEKLTACWMRPQNCGSWTVSLAESDTGIAPGQFCVIYQDRRCLGGAVITSRV